MKKHREREIFDAPGGFGREIQPSYPSTPTSVAIPVYGCIINSEQRQESTDLLRHIISLHSIHRRLVDRLLPRIYLINHIRLRVSIPIDTSLLHYEWYLLLVDEIWSLLQWRKPTH